MTVTAPADRVSDEVSDETPAEAGGGDERIIPEVADDAAVTVVEAIAVATPTAGAFYGTLVVCVTWHYRRRLGLGAIPVFVASGSFDVPRCPSTCPHIHTLLLSIG